MMGLDYSAIREKTKTASIVKNKELPLTSKELEKVKIYIEDMEKHILNFAENGKDRFTYDCSKISRKLFVELSVQFKNRNPHFFVLEDHATQTLVVDWTGKNEV